MKRSWGPDPDQLAAMPDQVRRRFLRLYRTFTIGLFAVLVGITVAVLVPGRPRMVALGAILVGALVIGGTFLFAFRQGYRIEPIPPPPMNGTASKEPPAESPQG
ncbi:MAG TPA: hypothetical protein VD948_00575 [Rhodothermales bacterium]|nr:hypothetical protein [Rhodothermales bacterium]